MYIYTHTRIYIFGLFMAAPKVGGGSQARLGVKSEL